MALEHDFWYFFYFSRNYFFFSSEFEIQLLNLQYSRALQNPSNAALSIYKCTQMCEKWHQKIVSMHCNWEKILMHSFKYWICKEVNMFDLNSHKEYPMDIIHSWKSADRNFLSGGDTSKSSVSHPNCSSDSSTKMSEKLCLQWNDWFEDNIKSAFGNLREDKDFTYVSSQWEWSAG